MPWTLPSGLLAGVEPSFLVLRKIFPALPGAVGCCGDACSVNSRLQPKSTSRFFPLTGRSSDHRTRLVSTERGLLAMTGSSHVQTSTKTWTHTRVLDPPSLLPLQTFIDTVFLVQLPWCSLLSFTGLPGHVPLRSPSTREGVYQGPWLCDQCLGSGGSHPLHREVCVGSRLQSLLPSQSPELPGNAGLRGLRG